MGVNFETGEVNRLAIDLAGGVLGVGEKSSKAIRESALGIERDGKAFCPVDTGFLKNSISTDITGSAAAGSMSAEIGPTANYGGYVEYGTSRQSPQAYMGPAFDRHAGEFERKIADIGEHFL